MTKQVRHEVSYSEGDWFAIPLDDGGYAVGLAARVDPRGISLGYFFGPRREAMPNLEELAVLSSREVIEVCFFGDASLRNGKWALIGRLPTWDRTQWPLPVFGRRSILSQHAWRVEYDEKDFSDSAREVPISVEECERLPRDGLSGDRAVEIFLTSRLGGEPMKQPEHAREHDGVRFFAYFPSEEAARGAAKKLAVCGYSVELDFRDYNNSWLLLATTKGDMPQPELLKADELMAKIAVEFAGEYDGYDRPVAGT